MGSELRYVELSSLLHEVPRNGLYKGKEFQGRGHRWIKMTEVFANNFFLDQITELLDVTESEIERFSCIQGDLLFGRTSLILEGVGECLLVEGVKDFPIFESNLFRIRFDLSKACPRFYFYYFKSKLGKQLIQKIAKQTAAASITASDLIAQPVPFFELQKAKKISELIYQFDSKIHLNRQLNQTLEQMAQALFKSWFVDFDPVIDNALAAGNAIPEELQDRADRRQQQLAKADHKPLPENIRELFPSEFELTESLGWVPKGWGVKSLDEIANYLNGLALQKFRPADENLYLPVLKISHLRQGFTDGNEKASLDIGKEYIVDNGDVIFSWSGTLLVDIWCGGRAALNQHLFKVTSKNYPMWFYYLQTTRHLEEFQRIATDKAVTMGHIKREHLKEAKCSVPSSELIEAACIFFEPLIEQQIGARLNSNKLTNLRDTLLPKLISGELRIPEAQGLVEEVLG